MPEEFYFPYFELEKKENLYDQEFFRKKLTKLEIIRKDDTQEEIKFFSNMFREMLSLFTKPFHSDEFDFADATFWDGIKNLGEKYSQDKSLRKMNGNRGSKHFLYINRTFFGLYNLLHDLKAGVHINNYKNS